MSIYSEAVRLETLIVHFYDRTAYINKLLLAGGAKKITSENGNTIQ